MAGSIPQALGSREEGYRLVIQSVCTSRGGIDMASTPRKHGRARVQRKNYRIDVAKLARAQKVLGTRTETETIHRALDLVADEAALVAALRNFVLKGGGHIEDVDARR
jgi:hypothetical protein